jgi:16S rRNA processing protein RimM
MAAEPAAQTVAIARIGRARGLHGLCNVFPFGQTLESLGCPVKVLVGREGAAPVPMVLAAVQQVGNGLVCRFEGVSDRTGAERLTNQVVSVRFEDLPQLQPGAYYHFELEGMEVHDGQGVVGTVRQTVNLPTTDAIEVSLAGGKTAMVPLQGGVVLSVDRTSRRIVVDGAAMRELM